MITDMTHTANHTRSHHTSVSRLLSTVTGVGLVTRYLRNDAFAAPSGTRPAHHYDELGARERHVRVTGYGR